MSEWKFDAKIEDSGEVTLEWYKDRLNVVVVEFDNTGSHDRINWAILLDGKPLSGIVTSGAHDL